MRIQYLIDSWLACLKGDDSQEEILAKLESLKNIQGAESDFGLNRIPFISLEQCQEYCSSPHSQKAFAVGLGRIITSLVLEDPLPAAVANLNFPRPTEITNEWLSALNSYGGECNAPFWRNPVIFFPQNRVDSWPKEPELTYTTSDGTERKRLLVCAENFTIHPYFQVDIDPWRVGTCIPPCDEASTDVRQRGTYLKYLPRPINNLLPLKLSLTEIIEKLGARRIDCSDGEDGKMYFIPEIGWDPLSIPKHKWRNGTIFNTGTINDDPRAGYKDRDGNVWRWDLGENHHWDVGLPDGGHLNVTPDGTIY